MKLQDIDIDGYETLFIDRDGVINKHLLGDYVKRREEFEFLPGVFDAFAKWNKHFKHIIIVTNQRGIGKGVMSEDDLNDVHSMMVSEIERHGGRVDKIYYCTALTDADPNRKPNIGMFLKAIRDFPDIKRETSLMIGDSKSDMLFAKNCGINGVMV